MYTKSLLDNNDKSHATNEIYFHQIRIWTPYSVT